MTDSPQALKYAPREVGKDAETLALTRGSLGQRNPQHNPPPADDPLGPPLTIREAAAVVGCSAWAIRQRYLPLGLPHFRIGKAGKITIYRNQLVRWILQRQQLKGGRP